jgi:hypothetical protein
MAVVKLFKGYGQNNAGELAGFSDDVAAKLVSLGWAMYVQSAPVAAVTKAVEVSPVVKTMEVAPMFAEKDDKAAKKKKG